MQTIIGLCGKRGVGKTTLAQYFADNHNFVKLSFAAPLRRIANQIIEDVSNKEKEKNICVSHKGPIFTPREFLLDLGHLIRKYDPGYFLRQIQDSLNLYKNNRVVIDDVRLINEYNYLRRLNAIIVRIERKSSLNIYKRRLNDPTETDLDSVFVNYTIFKEQNITREDLFLCGDSFLSTFKWRISPS